MNRQQEFVLRTIEERNIGFVRLWFTDVQGFLKSVAVAPAELEGAFEEGIGFDGSAIEGFSRVAESDTIAKPDPSTFQILPFQSDRDGSLSARMFCDITMPDGQPSWADPRQVLRRQMNTAAEMGFTCYVHPEIEFFLVQSTETNGLPPVPTDTGGYFDQAVTDEAPHFRADAINTLERMGISVEFSHHEAGPGQNEIDLRYADALQTADNIMTFRTVIREVALSQGIYATFMPKPFSRHPGSGMHTHFSLFEGDTNAFYEAGAEFRLSDTGRHFIAGLLRHAPEFTSVTNQFVNSYKRLWAGDEAPSYMSWGHNNRSALVRVPLYKPDKVQSSRIEYRGIDSATNPYLSYAALLGAGLKGIEKEYELPPVEMDDVFSMSSAERRAVGHKPLPSSLHDAIGLTEESEFMAELLGEQVFEYFLRNKRRDWDQYRQEVSPYELRTNLGIL